MSDPVAVDAGLSQNVRDVIKPRPLAHDLDDYWKAVADTDNPDMFSLGYQWADKPHRLLYDLVAYALHLEAALQAAEERGAERMRERAGAINIIFDGSPGPEGGRFVEVETDDGKSINIGEWSQRPDGLWSLRIEGVQL